jgi:hypothetical protein
VAIEWGICPIFKLFIVKGFGAKQQKSTQNGSVFCSISGGPDPAQFRHHNDYQHCFQS